MINKVTLSDLAQREELVPQAIINESLENLAKRNHVMLDYGHDDLDEYRGFAAEIVDGFEFAVLHYKGHPKNTFTIYLPKSITDLNEITNNIDKVIALLGVHPIAIQWQRRNDPNL